MGMRDPKHGRVTGSITRLGRRLPGNRPIVTTIVAVQIVFLLLPTLIVLAGSFHPGEIIRFPPDGLSLRWYAALPKQGEFVAAFWRSVYVAVFCTLFSIPVGILTGLGLIRYDLRFKQFLQLYFLLPFTVPLIVSGTILLIIFGEIGVLGQLWTVGLALTIINIPFMIWSVTARVNALDSELHDAAQNLGAEELQTFLHVTIPAILPGVVSGALLMFILGLNEFLVSLLITTPDIVTLPVVIYTSIRADISPLIAAVASVYVIVAVVAVILADRVVGLEELLGS